MTHIIGAAAARKIEPLVPFIRAFPPTPAFPRGERKLQQIKRSHEVYMLACRFLAHGGRYLMAEIEGEVHLVAAIAPAGQVVNIDTDIIMLAEEKVPNGPGLPEAVDRLVRASLVELDKAQEASSVVNAAVTAGSPPSVPT